jgi:hypothetical protein
MEHPARRALLIAPALMFDSVIPNIYGNSIIILTCLDTVGKNRVKNAEKPAVFSAKKRENRVLFLTGR